MLSPAPQRGAPPLRPTAVVRGGTARGQQERRHGDLSLATDAQRGTAGDEHCRPRRLERGDLRDLWRRVDDLFDVVQDEQPLLRPQEIDDLPQSILAHAFTQPQGLDNCRDDVRCPGDGRKIDEDSAIRQQILHRFGHGECEARLASAAGTGEGHQSYRWIREQGHESLDLGVATDQH